MDILWLGFSIVIRWITSKENRSFVIESDEEIIKKRVDDVWI